MRRRGVNTDVAEFIRALRSFLKQNDMLAYLSMTCNRLLELHRVLKPTGSLYLHCDPTASHYLKLVLELRKRALSDAVAPNRRFFPSKVCSAAASGRCTPICQWAGRSLRRRKKDKSSDEKNQLGLI